ncbi:DUF6232 family protein [Pilimelia columellifera]|uniref:Uncharacterized protein n=1 Tax=Pilimelia columellifera subsp. columellifera TaxID=706583 RepID=A0ABN3NGR7_9ACTN
MQEWTGRDSRIYYRDRHVEVSAGAVIVDGRAYALTELTEVWHQRGARSFSAILRRGLLGGALLVPLTLAVVGVAVALSMRLSVLATVTVVLAAIVVGLATGPVADLLLEWMDRSYARGSREMQLWARWRGESVLLLSTGDRLRFGKIYRALQRAMEQPHLT